MGEKTTLIEQKLRQYEDTLKVGMAKNAAMPSVDQSLLRCVSGKC